MADDIEQLVRDTERHRKVSDDWRKAAILSLAIGNGGGLAALAAWSARLDEFTQAVQLFLPGMWVYTVGLVFAGALPFAAWWNADALAAARASKRDQEFAEGIDVIDARTHNRQIELLAKAERHKTAARFAGHFRVVLWVLLASSAICFLTATVMSLWTVSTSTVFHGTGEPKAKIEAASPTKGDASPLSPQKPPQPRRAPSRPAPGSSMTAALKQHPQPQT